MTKQLCFHYNSQGVVCPPTLKDGLFTVAAIDNFDHDPSSSASQTSFHGASISIFQYPEENEIMLKFEMDTTFSMREVSMELPKSYTCILTTKDANPEPSDRKEYQIDPFFTSPQNGVEEWIANLKQLDLRGDGNDNDRVSFVSFFAEKSCHKMPRTSSSLLPLLEE